MNVSALWAEIEEEYSWRHEEMRFFQNQLSKLNTEKEKDQFRRALVLLLYAHFEGFSKFAFSFYITTINKEKISCRDASYSIVAIALEDIFNALRNPDGKSQEFRNQLPDDKKLHVFARNKEFVERSAEMEAREVNIPDSVVDLESNLKPVVLRKNLYKLGFPHDGLAEIESEINRLLQFRNNIAHGATRTNITLSQYQELQRTAWTAMATVKSYIMRGLQNKQYLKVA